ncbi:hypothetical protein KIL84_011778 [Mauremys mutica]|uniref:Paraneoplastic antigen Ma-like N-terminal domain-containing protein n=1 Tax=Mauremys mutica TaxID=74926 RepID=A0A9D3XEC7_9SAUR|nr:hypothetical protein KIL84_011778 [Mauremys mutica]
MERGLLEDLYQGAQISVTKAVLVVRLPEDMEPNEIEESLDAAGILETVKIHTCIYSCIVKVMVTVCTYSKEADLDTVPKEVQVRSTPWKILGPEKSPTSVPMSLEVDPFVQKLRALMMTEKRT